jgi:hypothetical protein
MLLDPEDYSFTRQLNRGHAIARRELRAMSRDDFVLYPDEAAYGGTWLVAPLFMSSHYPGLAERFAVMQGKCPETTAFLRAIPGVTAAVFSWMEPGCHIYTHRDAKAIDVLRAHLPLEDATGARMRVDKEIVTWQEGRCVLFDGFVEHEAGHTGESRRVILMVDAQLEPTEFARLQAWREEHQLAIDPRLVLVNPFTRATTA